MKDSVAIVTGASQGIGRSTAIRLARDFSSVALVARSGAALEAVADEVRQNRAEPLTIALDLSQLESPETWSKPLLIAAVVSMRFSISPGQCLRSTFSK